MSGGVLTLAQMLDRLKGEAGISQNAAHALSVRDSYIQLLQRTQEELYIQHEWPHLKVQRQMALPAGQRYHQYPADLEFTGINQAWSVDGGNWYPVGFGIDPIMFNDYNSDAGERSTPLQRWDNYADAADGNMFEVWPIPDVDTVIRFEGRKKLGPLIEDTDKSTLNGIMIVLYAAADLLARSKAEDAPLKLQRAQQFLRAVKVKMGANKTGPFILGGGVDPYSRPNMPRIGLDYIPTGYGDGS